MSILLADIDATCAALGYTDKNQYHAEPDAILGLKHLIWILRRDSETHEYRRHIGHSKVLRTDLVYMLCDYVQDDEYADVLIRLLVILTNPTLLLYRDGPPKDNHSRKIFMELIDILQTYKSAFTNEIIWTALFKKLKKGLQTDWALRSEEQNLLIERVLVLLRNVLQVPSSPDTECRGDNDASIHDQIIWALHQSGILDLVLFVISSSDEHQFHLHCLEIICLLFREQSAESLADALLQRSASEKQRDEQELLAARRREKQHCVSKPPPGRHSRFGGTYVIRNFKSVSDQDIICHQPLERVTTIDFDREKEQQKRSFRHVKEEAQIVRRSAFSVRLCLREYCIEVLRSAYNTFVRQVKRVVERNSGSTSHDDSYLLWAIRFFMEFNRLNGLQLELVSESLSVQCFHWVLTRMQHDMDMIVSDKKQARVWAKRLQIGLQTFRELLHSMLALQKLQDDNARALFDMLLNNVCYVLEYRETILHLLMNYNEAHSTKVFLREVIETANIFIKMMEKFCKDTVVVQDKKKAKRRIQKKNNKKTVAEMEDELENNWAKISISLGFSLSNELTIPEEEQPIPFDATSEKSIDDQKEDCMIRINKLLREEKLEHAIALMRAGREVWPENDVFGSISAAPEDELLLLREIYMHTITTVEDTENAEQNEFVDDENDLGDEENDEYEDNGLVEKTFKFEDFAKRLLNPKIVRACTVVLADWARIPTTSLKAAVTILHRIAYGCSCSAMLFQAKLFLIFQQVLNAGRDAHQEELRRLAIFVIRKFAEVAPSNPKIYAELLFYKSIKEANELESGYCNEYESGAKGVWSEEQETELRFLFEENQRNPETDKDVIDWILDNIVDKTRTRRAILKKLKDMDLQFKAPTKRTTANAAAKKNLWRPEEDEELRSLYDQYRTEEVCLQRILEEFSDRRNKQQIIKRMLQLHIIADKSEILPPKPKKSKSRKQKNNENSDSEDDGIESIASLDNKQTTKTTRKVKNKKPSKPKQRKVIRTPLDVGTIRALLEQVDSEKYMEAVEWLKECLNDAADDTDEPAEEDDGIPLVPLLPICREAMEDKDFQKVLIALGIQPPILGIENYWRIPIYLNSADLKARTKILAGEEIEVEAVEVEEDDNEEESGEESASGNDENYNEESEDYFDTLRNKMNSIMFNKSDDEEKEPMKKKHKQKRTSKLKNVEISEDDLETVTEIEMKLNRKKKHDYISSDEEISEPIKVKAKKPNSNKNKKIENKKKGSDNKFDQLKTERKNKLKLSDMVAEEKNNDEEIDELDFNSEDFRKRLLELGDSEAESLNSDDDVKENGNEKAVNTNRSRRAQIIDSDSDEHEIETSQQSTDYKYKKTANLIAAEENDENEDNSNHNLKDTSVGINDNDSTLKNNKKRQRSSGSRSDAENIDSKSAQDTDDENESDNFIARRKSVETKATEEGPAKRRRFAIIDDDDDE
ncbi:protein timeless homolog [Teleopsis dalmanni]|uniref:protein timeless homolog n=1 Tax=Teleopsis dalmanni TaxID=139649 RepID=UPI0018CDA475|nr:protein timeless homolog [Teleopsis dalmanni]